MSTIEFRNNGTTRVCPLCKTRTATEQIRVAGWIVFLCSSCIYGDGSPSSKPLKVVKALAGMVRRHEQTARRTA